MKDHISQGPRTSNDVGGLYVKDGRLINERPDGMTGIQEAANLRRMKKIAYKEDMIARGIELSDMRKEMF